MVVEIGFNVWERRECCSSGIKEGMSSEGRLVVGEGRVRTTFPVRM